MNSPPEDPAKHEMSGPHALQFAEQICWIMFVMTPAVWWLQGSSVSPDQFVVRSSLVVLSAVGAITLRAYAIFLNRKPS